LPSCLNRGHSRPAHGGHCTQLFLAELLSATLLSDSLPKI
jgi:hypothetical protein